MALTSNDSNMHYPLSSPQVDIWFDQILHPDIPLYNIVGYTRIAGAIDPARFEQALNRVIGDHDALRIMLHEGKGLPTQTFAEHTPITLEVQDFSTQEDAHKAALAWMKQEFVKPFRLYDGFLFHFALCKISDNCYYWLNKYHHLIVDGWATALIVQRVAAAYNALVTGQLGEPKKYAYQEFIRNDQAYLESGKFVRDRDYWQKKYSDVPQPLLARRYADRFDGKIVPSQRSTLRLKRSFYNRLNDFASRHQVSTFHVILGVLYCYFVRVGHRDDFAIGLPILNRNHAAFKQTAGSFMGMSPAWFRFGRDLSFIELVAGIRKELQRDYRHQRFPIGTINRQLGLRGNQQLFDLTLSYAKQDYDTHFDGAPVHAVLFPNGRYPQGHALFVLIEEFHRYEDVNLYFDYNLSFFQQEDIERLQARLESLLGEILRRPEVSIRQLRIVSNAELKKQIGFHHNGFACRTIEEGIQHVKDLYDVTHISETVFDQHQDASVCLIEANTDIHIELVAGRQVESLLEKGIGLYHVCYEVSGLFLMMEKFIDNGASVISEPKPAPLFDNRLVAFLNTPIGIVELLEDTKSFGYAEPAKPAEQTIAVTATFTADLLKESLDFWMQELDLPFKVEFAPYNQVFQQLLDTSSLLSRNETGIDVVLVRFEDWVKSTDNAIREAEIEQNVQNFIQALTSVARQKIYIVCICPTSPNHRQWEDFLASEIEGIGSVYVIKSSNVITHYPVSRIEDLHAEDIGHIPYTPAFFTAMGTMIARKIHAIKRDPYKVIVLDCDETLWQGVCAEDGPLGIKIDPPHRALHAFMVTRQQAGILLCLCSKNQEADVFAVFEQQTDMPLKREHLVSWRINWQPKSENLKSLAEELNLGLSSFIFLDDSPLECAEVRAHCPAVTTIQLPADSDRIPQFLDHIWAFDQLKTTGEDQQRTRYYQQNLQRDRWHREALTFADFLAGLELETEISAMTDSQLQRVSQLTQRTNQFNLTTIRRTEAEIRQVCESGPFESLVVDVKDRFGDYGLVGAILFESLADSIRVDTFLLSCRALGRGVEHRMLAYLGQIATERRLESIEILYIPTPRNQIVLDFLESVGSRFKQPVPQGWRFDFPVHLVSELTYHPPVKKTSSHNAPRREETATRSPSALFNHIAMELHDVPQIEQRIRSRNTQSPQTVTETYVAPRTPEEELLASIWVDVLRLERVGIHDDFFASGGDSLIGTQVISRIHDTFAVELPLHALFEAPTIAQLNTRLNARGRESSLPPITRVERDKPLPLSFAQQRLWFLDQLESKSATYNLAAAVRLEGQLDPQTLERSLQAMVRRHESLRTRFPIQDGAPVAEISDTPFRLDGIDLRALSGVEQESEVQRLLKEEAMRPFDLTTGPLFRAVLFQSGTSSHILQIIVHHIIMDGWSHGIFIREWRVLYEAALKGHGSPLSELPVQYVDFAHWQRQWLTSEALDKQYRYWKQQLADAPALLELPTDFPRPPIQSYQGASVSFSLSDGLTAQLKQLSQQADTTLFMTLWSAFAIVLSRYSGHSGKTDIVIGSPIANRTHRDIESLIGFFVNTLVLRLDLSDNPPFEKVLRQARQVALDAYAHQDIPFEHLVEALQPERNLSHAPFFQVMFVLQNAPLPDLELPGLNLTILELESTISKFDLTLEVTETAAGLTCRLEYCTGLFERATIERLSGHLQTLLSGIVENPNLPIHELPLLTEAERQQFVAWNDTAVDYPQDLCIHQLFEAQVEKTPEAVAVVCEDRQLTYRELNARSNRLARYLQTLGVKPEVLVGICLERSLDMVIGLFGILKAGGAYLPLDPDYPAARLAFMLEDAQVPVLLTRSDLKEKLPEIQARMVCLDVEAEALSQLNPENLVAGVKPENLAYVIYTSGSTGKPKGTQIIHQGLTNYLSWSLEYYQVAKESGAPVHSPLGFDATITSLFLPLLAGQRIVLLSASYEADAILAAIQDFQNWSFIKLTPAHLEILNTLLPRQELSGKTRFLILGGEALFGSSLSLWRSSTPETRIINEYGPTETVVGCCIYEVDASTLGEGAVPIGRPIANTQLYILDNFLQRLPIGVLGELHIGGAGVARGYLNRPDLTAEKFIKNPFSDDPDSRLYKTGDLARYLPDGNIEYLGRLDNQVKIRGFRIELGEIEAALMEYPDVQEAVVMVREDEPGEKRLVAYVVSDLIPTRIPYRTECLVEYEDQLIPLQTADICTAGVLLEGKPSFEKGKKVSVQVRLPGEDKACWLKGRVAYSRASTVGIDFKLTPEEQILMEKGVTYELEDKGFINFLVYSLRDKLRHALEEKLPSYMVPSDFVLLISLPLTPNGKIDRQALSRLSVNYQLSEETFVAPRTADEKLLAEIWASVLGIERVGIRDNFFDLGGHSLLAVSLLAQIEGQFGKQLPLSALFQGPTIEELAKLLKPSTETTNQWSPLVAIQAKGTKRPFFCLPGAGGNVLYFHELARHLGQEQPFYGLQAVGLDGETAPDTRVEGVAARYVQEIRTVQKEGPYVLGGHSFGADVALEMSKQLQREGRKVARLCIFDSTIPLNQPIGLEWDEAQWMTDVARIIERLLDKKLALSLADFRQLDPRAQLDLLHETLATNDWAISKQQLAGLIQTFKANCQATYIPQDIPPVPISLFIAAEVLTETASGMEMERLRAPLKRQADWGWRRYADGPVDIHVVPGDHHTMMSGPHVQALAEKLSMCLKHSMVA